MYVYSTFSPRGVIGGLQTVRIRNWTGSVLLATLLVSHPELPVNSFHGHNSKTPTRSTLAAEVLKRLHLQCRFQTISKAASCTRQIFPRLLRESMHERSHPPPKNIPRNIETTLNYNTKILGAWHPWCRWKVYSPRLWCLAQPKEAVGETTETSTESAGWANLGSGAKNYKEVASFDARTLISNIQGLISDVSPSASRRLYIRWYPFLAYETRRVSSALFEIGSPAVCAGGLLVFPEGPTEYLMKKALRAFKGVEADMVLKGGHNLGFLLK